MLIVYTPKAIEIRDVYIIEVLKVVFSVRQNQRGNWWKVVFVAVEVLPVGSKPPAAVGEGISKGERHDSVAAAPLPTRASSLEQGRTEGPVESPPKLVEHIRLGSTRFADHASLELL